MFLTCTHVQLTVVLQSAGPTAATLLAPTPGLLCPTPGVKWDKMMNDDVSGKFKSDQSSLDGARIVAS